ncbi:type II secretion system protein [Roseiflexus sp. AH-315-K22]|nr:type II secretion system protein [Roseiflexus sp. AH-315-K22]
MPTGGQPRTDRRAKPSGFTIVELLIVIGVIGLLSAIVMTVGSRVSGSGKERLTEGALQSLGMALAQFQTSESTNLVPATVAFTNPNNTRQRVYHPVADATGADGGDSDMLDSVALFIRQLDNRSPEARSVVNGMSTKLMRVNALHDEGTNVQWDEPHQAMVTVFDAWDNPIRYVHPTFDGNIFGGATYPRGGAAGAPVPLDVTGANPFGLPTAPIYGTDTIRRYGGVASGQAVDAALNADGGICPNNQPYFYSAGPDGKVGFGPTGEDYNADNVYMVEPTFSQN